MAHHSIAKPPDGNKSGVLLAGTEREEAKKESLETEFAFRAFTGVPPDLIITCGERKWTVHKHIMSVRSEFFAKACDGRFLEGIQSLVNLPEDDPVAVDAMIQFIYLGVYCQLGALNCLAEQYEEHEEWLSFIEYDNRYGRLHESRPAQTQEPNTDDESFMEDPDDSFLDPKSSDGQVITRTTYNTTPDLPFHAHMYAMGEKYQVPSLKLAAQSYFEEILANHDGCVYTSWFREAARIVYASTISTDRGLRDVVSEAVGQEKDCIDRKYMKRLLGELDQMTRDVLFVILGPKEKKLEADQERL